MLRIDVSIFSGRPDPSWIISDEGAVRALLSDAADAAGEAVGIPGAGYDGLGYREVVVSAVSDDEPWPDALPRSFALGTLGARDVGRSAELARRVVADMTRHTGTQLAAHERTPLGDELRDLVLGEIDGFAAEPPARPPAPALAAYPRGATAEESAPAATCYIEFGQFNPGFWNRPEVQPRNNCYNYARNHRTDTFAQPGRAHGAQARTMACGDVGRGAFADGFVRRFQCLPDSEKPRWLTALVVWPSWDYHWYRFHSGNFWGHKPGRTPARDYDNSGVRITNPETCNRGNYRDFCGYFYAGRSVVIN
ncbi:hypothetical protein I5Q34_13330 [Streptomyces sp. AV19]|uniref:hypothetical protein n=1 Tax=Streptomyces sp. AV19 TaxID=2793068 RepID=UPI0018FE6D74|nr:hypothetical protein [Streptomyces sp. AV19]MBH1935244.1 hypothetical protein [Streptomyces sp. AV19]MDG4532060.1 hypothetical protein [Streptomyces sp. AV19]